VAQTQEACNEALGFSWWIIFFQLGVILLMVVMSLVGGVLDRFSTAMVATVAIVTTLLMYMSEFMGGQIYANKANKNVLSGLQAAMAGTVVMSMLNLIYIWLLADKSGALQPALRGGAAPPAAYPPAVASPVASSVAMSQQQQHVMYMSSPTPNYMPPTPDQGLKSPASTGGGVRM
jgi:hypothetical protein